MFRLKFLRNGILNGGDNQQLQHPGVELELDDGRHVEVRGSGWGVRRGKGFNHNPRMVKLKDWQ